jgi:hypothetical protein
MDKETDLADWEVVAKQQGRSKEKKKHSFIGSGFWVWKE